MDDEVTSSVIVSSRDLISPPQVPLLIPFPPSPRYFSFPNEWSVLLHPKRSPLRRQSLAMAARPTVEEVPSLSFLNLSQSISQGKTLLITKGIRLGVTVTMPPEGKEKPKVKAVQGKGVCMHTKEKFNSINELAPKLLRVGNQSRPFRRRPAIEKLSQKRRKEKNFFEVRGHPLFV